MLQNTYYHLLYPDSPYYSALWHIASPSSKFVATVRRQINMDFWLPNLRDGSVHRV
jgi:hypothetical protein